MKELKIFSAQPNDFYFIWQLQIQLYNFRRLGLSDKYHILVWKHANRVNGDTYEREWSTLQARYPEAHFHYYEQQNNEVSNFIQSYNYIPLLRPWLLAKHFKLHPDLIGDAILYLDSDVIFTKEVDFSHLIGDDTCYLSDTRSYIGYEYLDSKVKDVLPEKLEEYKTINPVEGLANLFPYLTRKDAIANDKGAGGAQYLLKNIDYTFWEDVFRKSIEVKLYFRGLNRKYFKDEDTGFQSWCADMWSVLYNLWKRNQKTECPPEMDFAWATDNIDKWDKVNIYHDAGASPTSIKYKETFHSLFYKRDHAYINNIRTPFEDDFSHISKEYCSYMYVQELKAAK